MRETRKTDLRGRSECRPRQPGKPLMRRSLGSSEGFSDDSVSKESACNAGDRGNLRLIPGWGRFPRRRK